MGIFRRKKHDAGSNEHDVGGQRPRLSNTDRDPDLTGLTVDQATHLKSLAARYLQSQGHAVQDTGQGVLVTADGKQTGLENLSRMVAGEPAERWPAIVEGHLGSLLNAWDQNDQPVDPATLLVKLRRSVDIPHDFFSYQPLEPLPGLVGVVAADLPDVVQEFGSLHRVGDRDDCYDRALRNLTALPLPEHTPYRIEENRPGTELHFFSTDDFFGAARVTVLPDLLRRTLGVEIPAHGVIVAIPTRHTLNVHIPQDTDTIQVINTLAVATVNQYDAEPGPISPDLFHIGPDMIATQLTRIDDDGKVVITVDGPVHDMFRTLGLITGD